MQAPICTLTPLLTRCSTICCRVFALLHTNRPPAQTNKSGPKVHPCVTPSEDEGSVAGMRSFALRHTVEAGDGRRSRQTGLSLPKW